MTLEIRRIEPQDNTAVARIVVSVLGEFGCIGPGWASSDTELQDMYSAYDKPGAQYYVIVDSETHQLLGGGGFSRLKGTCEAEGVCELQKLYFSTEARGLGLGKAMLERLLDEARQAGYQTMYLESIPQMSQAIGLYEKLGFQPLAANLGNTGHQCNCTVFMSRSLQLESAVLR